MKFSVIVGLLIASPALADWKTSTTKKSSTSNYKTSTTSSYKTSTTSSYKPSTTSSYKTSTTSSTPSSTTSSTSTKTTTSTYQASTVTVQASCTTSTSPYQSFYVNYNFENVGNGDVDPVALEPIGETDLLSFNNMVLINVALPVVAGIVGNTPPNSAAFSASITLQQNLTTGPGVITAAYTESIIDHFTALQWLYGCVIPSQETEDSVPVSCNITANGYNRAGSLVATQDFPFVATGLIQNYTFATFNSNFNNLYYIETTVTNNLTTAALIDNLVAELYQVGANAFYPRTS